MVRKRPSKRRKRRKIHLSNQSRRRKSSIIRIETLKGSIRDIQKELKLISFDKDINILALEQSIGKTYRCIEYIKQHHTDKKILYLTNKHEKLNEVERELPAKIIVRHWYGFGHDKNGCPHLTKKKKDLLKKVINPSVICNSCKFRSNCSYKEQFDKLPNVVIAPVQYIGTPYVYGKFKPDIMFIDESINSYDTLENKAPVLNFPNKRTTKWYVDTLFGIDPQDKDLPGHIDELESYEFNEKFPNHPHNIAWYPFLYYVFEYSEKNIPIVLMDATFEISLFKHFLKRYKKEKNSKFKPSIKVWYSEVENTKDSVIFVPFPDRGYWKEYFWDHTNPTTRENLEKIFKKMLELHLDLAFITYKNVLDKMPSPFKTNNFGAVSGLNAFKDCDALVVAGTYTYGKDGNLELMKKIFNDPNVKVNYGKEGWRSPKVTINGKQYNNFPVRQAENEQWDAIMRIRPYSRKKYVILLGYIADRFKNRLNYQELSTNQKKNNLDTIFGILENDIFKNKIDVNKSCNVIVDLAKGIIPSKVAENYKITKQVGKRKRPDTQRIRDLKTHLPQK